MILCRWCRVELHGPQPDGAWQADPADYFTSMCEVGGIVRPHRPVD